MHRPSWFAESLGGRRFVSLLLLLTVFSLPLHFHPVNAAARIANECGCIQGNRAQAGLAPAATHWAPVLESEPISNRSYTGSGFRIEVDLHVRAPPLSTWA